jgi:hypothetical protein
MQAGQEQQVFEYVLYTKEEFEAANKCSVSQGRQGCKARAVVV